MAENAGIKSKERVKAHGEVFTPDSIVMDMLELVDRSYTGKDEKFDLNSLSDTELEEYVSRTYLEPTCGDGQFLIRILSNKLEAVKLLTERTSVNKDLFIVKAVCSIYGVDIQEDNVIEARDRMLRVACGEEVTTFDLTGKDDNTIKIDLGVSDELKKVIEHVIDTNIVVGNTLLKGQDAVKIIEWTFDGEDVTIKRYSLDNLDTPDMMDEEIQTLNYMDLPSRREISDELEDPMDF